jgi:threonine aldolase
MKEFASDNLSGVCKEVMDKINEANKEHDYGYSFDRYTALARELMQKEFKNPVKSFVVANGSGANILCLKSMLQSYQGIICCKQTHINVHEVGGIEFFSGSKLIQVDSPDAKITIESVKPCLSIVGDFNFSQPKVIAISQPTELGTVYTIEELKYLCDFAHQNDMYVYVDGARISNALAYLNTDLHSMIECTGVDAFCFGGTKNGALAAEMIVFMNPNLGNDFIYIQKQGMQMMSKSRFISCQLVGLLENKVYLKNAKYANEMALYLANKLKELGIEFTQKVETNAIFIKMDPTTYNKLQKKYYFYINDPFINEVRLVTCFDTKKDEIDEFINDFRAILVVKQ